MPAETVKAYLSAAVATVTGAVAAVWVTIGMIFHARSEAGRAHTRIDSLEHRFDQHTQRVMNELHRFEKRASLSDKRIEDKLDKLIDRELSQLHKGRGIK